MTTSPTTSTPAATSVSVLEFGSRTTSVCSIPAQSKRTLRVGSRIWPLTGSAVARRGDDGVDVGQLPAERPRPPNRRAVFDQERGPLRDVPHPAPLRRDAERSDGVAVPVGHERDVCDAERL